MWFCQGTSVLRMENFYLPGQGQEEPSCRRNHSAALPMSDKGRNDRRGLGQDSHSVEERVVVFHYVV